MVVVDECSYRPDVSWDDQLRAVGATNVVFAIGFERSHFGTQLVIDDCISERALLDCNYDKFSGQLMLPACILPDSSQVQPNRLLSNLFGAGIAFPQHHVNEVGEQEPWIGFKRSVLQVDLMIDQSVGCDAPRSI